ncbi:hypothetical protein CDLVIII_5064 [Clostridium sp. DL-VIII]|uniref:ABC-2 transporter permease n=1 Tax=Clostridium sp. DL-VIII TaxID=641107 RepID=UPI00023B06AF|nr:ABC-2 transporter permease [Clostridium sp. DL-VIII]EHJ01555.1 hypothetical protein CDLVIII_5064 [Clostridium sp. DL-VIII]
MKNAMNYLKFDLRLTKEAIKYSGLLGIIFHIFLVYIAHSYSFGIVYLLFMMVVLAMSPFSSQGNEKSLEMYYMFPSKVSNMVMGRFLYLIVLILPAFTISGFTTLYLYEINKINKLEVIILCYSGLLSSIICLIQYPLYYKFGFVRGRMLSTIINFLPAFIVFTVPNFALDSVRDTSIELYKNFDLEFILLLALGVFVTCLIGYISYLLSCKICKEKEV